MPADDFSLLDYNSYRNPIVVLRCNGSASADLSNRIIEMKYNDSHRIGSKKKGTHVDKMEIVISDPRHEFTGDKRFEMDARWDVRFGYPHNLSDARWFLVKYYIPDYEQAGIHSKRVVLLGTGYMASTVRAARNWGRVSSSTIAKAIAKRHGLKADIEFSSDSNEASYVQPAGVSDFEYLSDLAADIDYEFYIENDQLVFQSRDKAYSKTPRSRFVYGAPGSILLSFKPTIKATAILLVAAKGADTGAGTGHNPKVDQTNVGGVHLGDDVVKSLADSANAVAALKLGVTHAPISSGADLQKRLDKLKRDDDVAGTKRQLTQTSIDLETKKVSIVPVPDSSSAVVKTPETNAQKVATVAKAVQRDFLQESVEATAEFIGDPIVQAKANFTIILPDPKLSGPWYCEETTHTISDKSYTVTAKMHRGALSGADTEANNRTAVKKNSAQDTEIHQRQVLIDLETKQVYQPKPLEPANPTVVPRTR